MVWAKVLFAVGRAGKNPPLSTIFARPIPAPAASAAGVVIDLILAEFQLIVIVGIDQRGKRASHGWTFRIPLSVFFEQIVGVAGKARVDASGGQARAAL